MSIKINDLKALLKAALSPKVSTDFSREDAQQAATNALLEYHGVNRETSIKTLKRVVDMAIIEEVIDEVLPAQLENIMGDWAEIKTFARDAEVKFTVKNIGKRRALLSIVEGAPGGVYKARRLDDRNVFIPVKTYTAGVLVTLEEILLGTMSLATLLDNILEGLVLEVYKNIVKALRAAKGQVPEANLSNGAGFVTENADKLIRIASAYGSPVIIAFQGLAAKISNAQGSSTPNVSVKDVDEVRSQGYVTIYKGTPVIRIPNFLIDETNSQWVFSEADAFILPTEAKPVKVAMKGEGYMKETDHPGGSVEQNYHKIMGTGIVTYNNIAIYTDTDISAAEASTPNVI